MTQQTEERVPQNTPNKYRSNNRKTNRGRNTQVIKCTKTGQTKFIKHIPPVGI